MPDRVRNDPAPSYWLALTAYTPGPALAGDVSADVVICGGGYTGLWTAIFLKRADPALRVVVLERDCVGHGASGRNGGFATPLVQRSLAELARALGDEARARCTGRPSPRCGHCATSSRPRASTAT